MPVRCSRDRLLGFISRYALGRDYHKILRQRLQQLAERIEDATGPFGYRVFTDSAPVLEKPLARSRPWLDRQAHQPDPPRRRLVVLSRRDLHRPAAAAWTHRQRPTAAPARPASMSARRAPSLRPTSSMRAAASPTSPSSSTDQIPEEFRPRSAIASMAATTASWCAPGTALRPRPSRTSRRATGSMRRSSSSCSPGPRQNSWSAPRARRSAVSVTSAGCATSPWRLAMRRAPAVIAALRPGGTTQRDGPGARRLGAGASMTATSGEQIARAPRCDHHRALTSTLPRVPQAPMTIAAGHARPCTLSISRARPRRRQRAPRGRCRGPAAWQVLRHAHREVVRTEARRDQRPIPALDARGRRRPRAAAGT